MTDVQGPGMTELSQDLSRIREDLGKLTDTVAQMVTGTGGTVRGRVKSAVEDTRHDLEETAATLMHTGREYAEGAAGSLREAGGRLESSIERNPLAAVMIAAALGLAVGMMGRHDGR